MMYSTLLIRFMHSSFIFKSRFVFTQLNKIMRHNFSSILALDNNKNCEGRCCQFIFTSNYHK